MIGFVFQQGKKMYFQLFEGNFILNKNLTKVLNFILSISTMSWGSKPKVPILWH